MNRKIKTTVTSIHYLIHYPLRHLYSGGGKQSFPATDICESKSVWLLTQTHSVELIHTSIPLLYFSQAVHNSLLLCNHSYIQRICQQRCSLSSTGISIFIFMSAVTLAYRTCLFNFHPLHNTPGTLQQQFSELIDLLSSFIVEVVILIHSNTLTPFQDRFTNRPYSYSWYWIGTVACLKLLYLVKPLVFVNVNVRLPAALCEQEPFLTHLWW